MKIKSLELVGFKSFCEKTVINFSEGVTAIVGPNGSGKSNVVDAIRWLLGETAPTFIRTKLLEDIIFSGSEAAPPMGMAEVTLIFDNTEGPSPLGYESYSELQITRRAYRDGESEFFINKVPCRLKDIVELSLDTGSGARGYCIIEQAKVQQIITGKPDETRMLIEEAAGVAKYRMRKKEALRKLETTRQNLLRVSDILLEVKRQLGAIDRQARKARRYKKLKERSREIEIEVLRRRAQREKTLKRELELPLEALLAKVRSEEDKVGDLKVKEQKIRNTMFGVETEIDSLRVDLGSANESFFRLDTELEGVAREIKSVGERKEGMLHELNALDLELGELKKSLHALVEKVGDTEGKILAFDVETDPGGQSGTDRGILEKLRGDLEQKRDELVDLLSKVGSLDNSLKINEKWIFETERKKNYLERELAQLRSEMAGCTTKLEEEVEKEKGLMAQLFNKNEDFQRVSGELLHYEREHERLQQSIESSRGEREHAKSRILALSQVLEGYELFGESVSYIMNEFRTDNDGVEIIGVLGELIGVEEGYENAVEAALGESLKYIVVRDSGDGIMALHALKGSGRGRASFAPVKLRKRGSRNIEVPAGEGVISSVSGIISAPSECRELIEDLLGDVLLVNTVEDAVRLWKTNGFWATYVTLEGDLVLPSGIISGGNRQGSESGILIKKREMAELESRLIGMDKDIGIKEEQLGKYGNELAVRRTALKELAEAIQTLEKKKHEAKVNIDYHQKELDTLKKRDKWGGEELSHLAAEIERYRKQSHANREELEVSGGNATILENEISLLKEQLEKLERDLKDREERTGRMERERVELKELKHRLDAEEISLKRIIEDREHYRKRIFMEFKELEGREAELTELKEKMIGKLKDAASVREKIEKEMGEKVERASFLKGSLDSVEKEMGELFRSLEDSREEVSSLREQRAAVKARLENITSVARDSYGVENVDDYQGAEEFDHTDDEAIAEEMHRLKGQLESIGEVNISAIEERDELAERYESLGMQKEDLEISMGDLQKVISKIDRESKDKFARVFHEANDKFKELFPKLFTGGKGYLKLTDDENLLESGVELVPQPPGKKLKNLSLLSNGEKALTGICLLLSLFFIRPGPFLFLDEVDAPLDEANVDRFNKLIREISDECQIIMITHKKRTMELADYLYGTTMDRPGISRIVSAQLS